MLFFDLIEANLNPDKPSHKIAGSVLDLLQNVYEYKYPATNTSKEVFSNFKTAIKDTKQKQQKINLILQDPEECETTTTWDPNSKSLFLPEPSSHSGFLNSIFNGLYYSSTAMLSNPTEIASLAAQVSSGNYFSAALKLGSYFYQHTKTVETTRELHNDAMAEMENLAPNSQHTLKNYLLPYSAPELMSVTDFVNSTSRALSDNTLTQCYSLLMQNKNMQELQKMFQDLDNLELDQFLGNESDPEEQPLKEMMSEIIALMKAGAFDLAAAKEKYCITLGELVAKDPSVTQDYFCLCNLLLQNGQRPNIKEFNHIYAIADLFVQVGNSEIDLTTLDATEKELVHLGLDALESYLTANKLSSFEQEVEAKFWPRLVAIKVANPELAAKYEDSLYTLNKKISLLPAKEILKQCDLCQETQELLTKVDAYLAANALEVTFALERQETQPFLQELTSTTTVTEENVVSPTKKPKLS